MKSYSGQQSSFPAGVSKHYMNRDIDTVIEGRVAKAVEDDLVDFNRR